MKNVTVTLDEKTAAWARIHAARRGMSLSRFLGDLLHTRMREAHDYDRAMRRYLARAPALIDDSGQTYPERHELHDRPGLR